ncbi:DUF6169 family protein [Mucilaginibacter sp. AW1-3]
MDEDENEIAVISFGFTCDSVAEIKRYDGKVRHTIIHIIQEFFVSQPDNALLYMCMDNDGKGRNRQVTFGRWFREADSDLEKHNFNSKIPNKGFYSSIILRTDNPEKERLIAAFYHTIDYWGLYN